MYESRHIRPLSRPKFLWRFLQHFLFVQALVGLSLLAGMEGYRHYEHMNMVDSFVNAAMLLGGMGPVDPLQTRGGRIFAGWYAIYCGLVVLVSAAVLFAPLLHRIMHTLHWHDTQP